MSNDYFYEELAGFSDFNELINLDYYRPLPEDWIIIITDVRGSTKAIEDGRYKDVNALGVASIVAILNAVRPLSIPYVFGGDGATLCVPAKYRDKMHEVLVGTQEMAAQSFGLELRIGMVDMHTILAAGYQVQIGKHQPHENYQQAMFWGGGLEFAEALVKDPAPENRYLVRSDGVTANADFSGFECRWNSVPSPHEETISLLVQVLDVHAADADQIYANVLNAIQEIYGDEERHRPIREELLSLGSALSLRNLRTETLIQAAAKTSWERIKYRLRTKVLVWAGQWMMWRNVQSSTTDWGGYRQHLVANTDFRKFDAVLRMVIAGTAAQRQMLRSELEELRQNGQIVFGIHASADALVTCIISDYNTNHAHFLDGSNGGYAMAARELKQQLKALPQ